MTIHVEIARQSAGPDRVLLSGAIDEQTSLDEVFGQIDGDIVLDCSGIERVNSIGVNAWVKAFKAYTEAHRVILVRLSYAFAMQANSVANLFGAATVRSTLAPYFCAGCQTNPMVEVTAEEVFAVERGAPQKQCTACEAALEFDELDDYFDFLRRGR